MAKIKCIIIVAMVASVLGCSGTSKSTSVHVVKLETSYRVWIDSHGRYSLPISPEGPFPKWSDCSMFLLKGVGETTNGTSQFIIGSNAVSFYSRYKSGYIKVNDKDKSLQLCAELGDNYKTHINHSGIYKNCKFDIPLIETVLDYTSLNKYKGSIVKIAGSLQDNWHCKMNGGVILLSDYYEVGPKYEFIGWIDDGYGDDKYRLAIYDHRIKDKE